MPSTPRHSVLEPRAVCFDLDGVLIDTMPLHARAWQEALKPLGLRVSRRTIYEWEGEPGLVTAAVLLRRHGRPASRPEAAALLGRKERRFQQLARRVRLTPALSRMMATLAGRGLPMALVTGTSGGEVRRVVPGRVLRQFDAVITGDQVRRGKPHPGPYRTAFRRLRTRPDSALVVENAPYGIQSARRAGAGRVIALASSLPRVFLREAHVTVASVPQLCRLLDRLTR
jgi:beta-phosphoglucomutase